MRRPAVLGNGPLEIGDAGALGDPVVAQGLTHGRDVRGADELMTVRQPTTLGHAGLFRRGR